MKKLLMISLFVLANISFKAEAISWNKVVRGTQTSLAGAFTLFGAATVIRNSVFLALSQNQGASDFRDEIKAGNYRSLALVAACFTLTGIGAILTKISYDKYKIS